MSLGARVMVNERYAQWQENHDMFSLRENTHTYIYDEFFLHSRVAIPIICILFYLDVMAEIFRQECSVERSKYYFMYSSIKSIR